MAKKDSNKGRTCGECGLFGKKRCAYDDVERDSKPCKKFMTFDDYEEVKAKEIEIGDKQVRIVCYTWKGGAEKIKIVTKNTGRGGKEYETPDFRFTKSEAKEVAAALVKFLNKL